MTVAKGTGGWPVAAGAWAPGEPAPSSASRNTVRHETSDRGIDLPTSPSVVVAGR
jgi:hypothetical protein